MSSSYLCLEDNCIQQSRQFFTDHEFIRDTHKDHYVQIVDPLNFVKLFDDGESLFTHQEIKKLENQLHFKYSQLELNMINRVLEIITLANEQAKKVFLLNTLEMAKVFRLKNQTQFVNKIKQNGSTPSVFLSVANAFLKNRSTNIKPVVSDAFRQQIDIHIAKTQMALKQSMSIFTTLMKSAPTQLYHDEQQRQQVQDRPPMEQEVSFGQVPLKAVQIEAILSQQKEIEEQQWPTSQAIPNVADSVANVVYHPPPMDIIQPPEQTPQPKPLSKEHKIQKNKLISSVHHFLPTYENIFKQLDMDAFFPKGPTKQYFRPISQLDPSISLTQIEEIVIQDDKDISLIRENMEEMGKNCKLTITQINTSLLNTTLALFNIANQFKSIHFHGFVINSNCEGSLRALLANNLLSLQTLMLEECWFMSKGITQLISKMRNLRYLKLHGSFKRRIQICFPHIHALHRLQYLSLSSAAFIDAQDQQIHYSSRLSDIYELEQLKHLCIYNCYPVFSELLGYLNPKLHKSLEHLNIGITDVASDAIEDLSKLKSLRELFIGDSQIKGSHLVRTLEMMKTNRIKELSVWQQDASEEKRRFMNGPITQNDMISLSKLLPHLQYINIKNHDTLRTFNLLQFPNLKYACVHKGLYHRRELKRFAKKIQIFEDSEEVTLKTNNIQAPFSQQQECKEEEQSWYDPKSI